MILRLSQKRNTKIKAGKLTANLLNGGLMPLGLLVLFFSPMIAAKLRAKT
jgi:hypothetical protein